MRSRWTLLIGLVATAIGGSAWGVIAHLATPQTPRAFIDRDSHNWGHVLPGEEVATRFVIQNDGRSRLELGEPQTSCGCTKPRLPKTTLRTGERIILDVGFHAPTEMGAVQHFVKIPTNDPDRPLLTFFLFAETYLSVRAAPQAVDFGGLPPGATRERLVQLHSPDRKPFRLRLSSQDLPEVSVRIEHPESLLPVHRVVIVFTAGERLGHAQGVARIATDRDDVPYVGIPIHAQIEGPVEISPSSLTIEKEDIGRPVERVLLARLSSSSRAKQVRRVEVDPPWELLGQSTKAIRPGESLIRLTLRFPQGSGAASGRLSLVLDDPRSTAIDVPLTIHGWTPPFPGVSP